MGRPLISVRDLTLQFDTDEGRITAVNGVSFDIAQGEVMGLVGESGSGKSVTAKSLMQLNARNAVYGPDSRIILNLEDREVDVLALKSPADLLVIRGGAISMVFQEPMASFAPALTIGSQMVETLISNFPRPTRRTPPSICWRVWASRTRRAASASMYSSSPAACVNAR